MRALAVAAAFALVAAGCARQMALEYVTVKFPEARGVLVDGAANGSTNEVLRVDSGTHEFSLLPGGDYEPASVKVTVKDTTALQPMVVEFRKKGVP